MKTGDVAKEQVSALADGEVCEDELDALLAELRQSDKRQDWDLYHRIGDIMRSDDMDVALSPDFSARMAARLDAEPTILAPVSRQNVATAIAEAPVQTRKSIKRFAIPSIAAAAAAFAAFVATPQLMVTTKTDPMQNQASSMVASASAVAGALEASANGDAGQGDVILRDPQIDEYLFAHQRFSPSLYSTAQFARSATFTNESDK